MAQSKHNLKIAVIEHWDNLKIAVIEWDNLKIAVIEWDNLKIVATEWGNLKIVVIEWDNLKIVAFEWHNLKIVVIVFGQREINVCESDLTQSLLHGGRPEFVLQVRLTSTTS